MMRLFILITAITIATTACKEEKKSAPPAPVEETPPKTNPDPDPTPNPTPSNPALVHCANVTFGSGITRTFSFDRQQGVDQLTMTIREDGSGLSMRYNLEKTWNVIPYSPFSFYAYKVEAVDSIPGAESETGKVWISKEADKKSSNGQIGTVVYYSKVPFPQNATNRFYSLGKAVIGDKTECNGSLTDQ